MLVFAVAMLVFAVIKILAPKDLGTRFDTLAITVLFQQTIFGGERKILMVRPKNVRSLKNLLRMS
jgi:hypothetical protein